MENWKCCVRGIAEVEALLTPEEVTRLLSPLKSCHSVHYDHSYVLSNLDNRRPGFGVVGAEVETAQIMMHR
jgi:hypothetical protein